MNDLPFSSSEAEVMAVLEDYFSRGGSLAEAFDITEEVQEAVYELAYLHHNNGSFLKISPTISVLMSIQSMESKVFHWPWCLSANAEPLWSGY